ncbi:carcinoembryonic antigen-related cell adhesion molecule 2-like, partial [Scleropages formosus]
YEALPPGPVIGAVGGSVTFPTSVDPTVAPVFQTISWTFYNTFTKLKSTIVTSAVNPSLSVIVMSNNKTTIGDGYAGRVSLNIATGCLQLRNLTLKDNGQYGVLMVSNGNVICDGNTTLNVYERISGVSINETRGELIADNSNATLNCSETSGTGIVREWLKGGQQLFPSNRITFSEDNTSVFFHPVQSDDNGLYQCRLTNPVSTGTATYRLIVNYGPEHVAILGDKTAQVGSAMLLYCSALSVPVAAFTWTVNDTETEVNTAGYLIENSSYSHSGNYTCTAWNAVTNLKVSTVHVLLITEEVTAPTCAGLTPGQIAGIAIGTVVVVLVLALAVYFGLRHG